LTGSATASPSTSRPEGRIGSWVQNLAIEKEIGDRGTSLGEFRVRVKLVRDSRKSMQLARNPGIAKGL